MIGFLIKKTFFDLWDNIASIILMNIAAAIMIPGFFILPSLFGITGANLLFYVVPGVVVINFFFSAISRYTLDISNYKKSGILAFLRYIRDYWKQSLITSLFSLAFLGFFLLVLPFSLASDSIIFLAVGGLSFWLWLTAFNAFLYFLPASVRLKKTIPQSLRFAISFVFDNSLFCFFMLLGTVAILALSVFLVFLIPGVAAAALFLNVGFKLRIYKYVWLETHPGADRKSIPWSELIADDYERVGKRTLRGMLFPWKQ